MHAGLDPGITKKSICERVDDGRLQRQTPTLCVRVSNDIGAGTLCGALGHHGIVSCSGVPSLTMKQDGAEAPRHAVCKTLMRRTILFATFVIFSVTAALVLRAQQSATVISVDVAHPGAAKSPKMFGIFFEDINFGADGGLYPERVKNRSFEFTEPLAGWHEILPVNGNELDSPKGELIIRTEDSLNVSNPHYLRMRVYKPGLGFSNTGYRGIGVESGAEYRFSAYVRSQGPKAMRASLRDEHGKEIGAGTLTGFNGLWKRYETVIRPSATTANAQLNVFIDGEGSIDA